jgi:signal transduction histidine kinase
LDEAIRVTAELTRLKSKFLANVTHELRTPLNGIINYIGFVLDNPEQLNADQVVHLKQALTGAERLLDLINNILDMSKIEAGQMTLIKRPVDLSEVLAELEPVALELLGGKPVQYVTNIAPTLPLFVGDRMRLRQIILNMVSNASKFTERGKIQVDLYPQNGSIIIKVSDTGPGIKQAALPTIFERFATTGLIDTQELFGPGLGLPITKSLVELHHGHITVDSQPHTGTIFTVDLPLQTDE